MNTLRENTPKSVSGYKVVAARDYKLDTIKNMETGEVTPTGLPTSNVLYYELENNAWLCVRPSGTEPKIKFYFGIVGTSLKDAEDKAEDFMKGIEEMVNTLV
jgi:phosphoglucomutase